MSQLNAPLNFAEATRVAVVTLAGAGLCDSHKGGDTPHLRPRQWRLPTVLRRMRMHA